MSRKGFNFTGRMRDVVQDMIDRLPELAHIDQRRIAMGFAQARKRTRHGVFATLTPMRFEGGSLTTKRRGKLYTVQRVFDGEGREFFYILSFYLPRFMEVDLSEKLVTILHELWHISPQFDGDLRRHPGRCYVHSHSQREYDARMKVLADRWLASNPPESLYDFLYLSFSELHQRYGGVYGVRIPHPKLILANRSNAPSLYGFPETNRQEDPRGRNSA